MWQTVSYWQDCFPGKNLPDKKHFPKTRFLLDENIPEYINDYLKRYKCNIKTIREIGAKGAADDIVRQIAKKQERVLLTEDRDFINSRKFPLKSSPGLIIVEGKSALQRLTYILGRMIIPRPHLWKETKIILHHEALTCHYIDSSGKTEIRKIRCMPKTRIAVWEE